MKKITFILMVFGITLGFSQNVPIDFETGGNGANWTWTVFENTLTPPALEIIANPFVEGINTSSTVAKYTILPEAGGFAGVESQRGADIGTWTVTEDNAFVTLMVRQVGFTGVFGLKFSNNEGGAFGQETLLVPQSDEWVELSFDMSEWIGSGLGQPNQIIFFVDINGARGALREVYIDNVNFAPVPPATCDDGIMNGGETGVDCGGPCDACPPPPMPMVAAPTPTVDPSQVINVFSDFYGPNSAQGANAGAIWAGNSASTLVSYSSAIIDGSSPPDYLHFYQGATTVFIPFGPPINATAMNFLHVDIWSTNGTSLRFEIQDNSPASGILTVSNLIPNQWNSVEIVLPTGPDDRDSLGQLNLVDAGGNDFYFDNLYYSAVTTLGLDNVTTNEFEIYPNPTNTSWVVKGSQQLKTIQIFDILGKQVFSLEPNAMEVAIDASNLISGIYLAKIANENGVKTVKLVKN